MSIQLIAIIAVLIFGLSFHSKTRVGMLSLQALGLILWAVHFSLLAAWTAVGIMLINIIVAGLFIYKEKYAWISQKIIFCLVIFIFFLVTVVTWKDWWSITAFLGVFFVTIARWQNELNRIRIFSIPASILWIFYDCSAGSYGGVVAEIFIIISTITSFEKNSSKVTQI